VCGQTATFGLRWPSTKVTIMSSALRDRLTHLPPMANSTSKCPSIKTDRIRSSRVAKRPATEEQTASFLKLVNDAANWPVYVHCKGGRHRTGELTAIYRITNEGWTADQTYQEMK
jgi:protein tyrosine/serine phosphatase